MKTKGGKRGNHIKKGRRRYGKAFNLINNECSKNYGISQEFIMWIAKNSKTNETYGKKFESIYDCQEFIDKELYMLEYLYRRCECITKSIKNEKKFHDYMHKKYPNGYNIITQIVESLTWSIQPLQKDIKKILQGKEIKKIAQSEYHSNNIIRCYNVGQHRYADGFDF